MGSIGWPELLVILLIAFLIFGAKRLPEIGAGLGRAIRKFQKGIQGAEDEEKAKKTEDREKSKDQ